MNSHVELTRDELAADVNRTALACSSLASRLLDDAALERSRIAALKAWDRAAPLWVFGYGSLVWNPQLQFTEKRVGTIYGAHRRLCLWSRVNRGTPDSPGLVFGLERGGACKGVAYAIAPEHVHTETTLLWRREMLFASYVPTWFTFRDGQSAPMRVLSFSVDRQGPGYAGKLSLVEISNVLRKASGRYGTCRSYVDQTIAGLAANGIVDRQLTRLAAQKTTQRP